MDKRMTLSAEEREALWTLIAEMRDDAPRAVDDLDTDALIDGLIPWLAARDAAREQALRKEIARQIETAYDEEPHTDGCGIDACSRCTADYAARIARGETR